jgi:hypothetical protein
MLVTSGRLHSAKLGTPREWREVCFAQFRDCCLTIRPLAHMVGEAGIEPALLLVTSVRLRGVKMVALREWREVMFAQFR